MSALQANVEGPVRGEIGFEHSERLAVGTCSVPANLASIAGEASITKKERRGVDMGADVEVIDAFGAERRGSAHGPCTSYPLSTNSSVRYDLS